MIGNAWLDLPITMRIERTLNSSTGETMFYGQTCSFEDITKTNPGLFLEPLSTSGNETAWYPYLFVDDMRIHDWWQAESPAIWADILLGGWMGDREYVTPADMEGPVTFGQYLYLGGLRLRFKNNTTVDCSPTQVLLWSEFRWNGTEWSTSSGTWDSMSKNRFLGESAASLIVQFPVDWTSVGSWAVALAVIVGGLSVLELYRRHGRDDGVSGVENGVQGE
ncbi:hypothetical protein EU538_04910 [Candidatus Thorarchaeota archaeon]|nr:MAG: hypothetical protein EU538_04910 [Candidatus Thorarchaeota archaeon]